jgi:protein involved in ribonucleotide reduction
MVNEMSWYQFSTLPGMNKVAQHEVERQYRIYLNEIAEQRIAIHLIQEQRAMAQAEAMAVAASNGGGGGYIQQEQSDLPSGCIQFVNNTSDGTQCRFWIETSAPTNYTITWGDGETTTGQTTVGTGAGVGIGDGEDKLEIDYTYADSFTEYTARICFDDISLVTYLEFNGDN